VIDGDGRLVGTVTASGVVAVIEAERAKTAHATEPAS
jgi:Mg/Co/Ni transporter MgtE